MNEKPILFFDSGIGGLTVLRETRIFIPDRKFIYVADDAAFPYGAWQEDALKAHIITLFEQLLCRYKPLLCVLACNTASTLVLKDLRRAYPDIPFIGTVPAIKPAAEQTRSKLISVLATPGTVKRAYTRDLISSFASKCHVRLVGSAKLAGFAEDYLRRKPVDCAELKKEIAPCFVEKNGNHTDIVVLACTHYPFLVNLFRKYAEWPVDWIDPAEAVAKRALSLLPDAEKIQSLTEHLDLAHFTSGRNDYATNRLLHGFGLKLSRFSPL
ncbi:glutamate racemase [uncultured Bartonella sp.]|uniref:glutamate racemase n=1 Tax=uncultured Bartonella sp. TaxID=104108 RepID=UPI00261843EA|nr:glutamate racemase [uncultured Bartonella sp.]